MLKEDTAYPLIFLSDYFFNLMIKPLSDFSLNSSPLFIRRKAWSKSEARAVENWDTCVINTGV